MKKYEKVHLVLERNEKTMKEVQHISCKTNFWCELHVHNAVNPWVGSYCWQFFIWLLTTFVVYFVWCTLHVPNADNPHVGSNIW
jgi:hypothetical protein